MTLAAASHWSKQRVERAWLLPAMLAPALLVVGGALKLPEALLPMGSDTGMYAYYARVILSGGRPYVDFWDVHPPLVFYYWVAVQAIAGTDWSRTCAGGPGAFVAIPCSGLLAHGLDLLLSVGAALLVYAIARRVGGSAGIAALAALCTVFFANVSLISDEGSIPGKLILLPTVLAVWSYLRVGARGASGWVVVSGAAVGVTVLAKQPGLVLFAALGGHAWWEAATGQQPMAMCRRRWAGLAVGAALVLGGVAGYFWLIGALGPFVEQAWIYNFERLFRGYWHSVGGLTEPAVSLQHVFRDAAGLLFVGALAGALALALSPTHPSQRLLLCWAAADTITILGFREFAQVVPSFALLAAFGIGRVWDDAGRGGLGLGHPWAGRLMVVVLFASLLALSSQHQVEVTLRAWNDRGPSGWLVGDEHLAGFLRRVDEEVPPGPVFVWGNAAQLYARSGRESASRFLNTEALGSFSPGYQRNRAELMQELAARPPGVIIGAPDAGGPAIQLERFPELSQFIDACYQRVNPFAHLWEQWKVYVRVADRPGCASSR
ncbi:MAG: glycosyltransferase family 39 protein [Chloroflexi bacterium]|nr:glycosyltransferase family 39 protein [Chloroflexota bacterium]